MLYGNALKKWMINGKLEVAKANQGQEGMVVIYNTCESVS